jgi:hypothetical protein
MDEQSNQEFEAILEWASSNTVVFNISKTKEAVFRRPNPEMGLQFPFFSLIEQIIDAELLGGVPSPITCISMRMLISFYKYM